MKFDESGFYFNEKFIPWGSIKTIYTYKIDVIVYDEIILELSTEDNVYRFSESEENWFGFAKIITEKFKLNSFEWYFEVMKPAFQENRKLLFNRE